MSASNDDPVPNPILAFPARPAAAVADDVEQRLDPRTIAVERIGGAIAVAVVAFVLLIAVVIVAFAAPLPRWAVAALPLGWLVATAGLMALALGWPALSYRHTSYRLSASGIRISRGVFWRSLTSVPSSRVQHTDVSQGPIERAFELATLVIYTAGTQHAAVHLGGLSHATALSIRDRLLEGAPQDDAV
jgi:membrane protein YdbS with pleckstrin-like domain